jgi:actin-like protein 6A
MYNGTGENIGAVVADIGSSCTKVGFAGEDWPRAYLPTAVGVNGAGAHHVDGATLRGDVSLSWPIQAGEVRDWDMVEEILNHSLERHVKASLENHPVMLCEKSIGPRSCRHKYTELLFEKHNTPALFISKDAPLLCYAVGRTTGLAVDISETTTVTPVMDGWAERRGTESTIIGCSALHQYCSLLMAKNNKTSIVPRPLPLRAGASKVIAAEKWHPSLRQFWEKEIARDILEQTCRVADTVVEENAPQFANVPGVAYTLPDGTEISVGINRFLTPELYFTSELSTDDEFLKVLASSYPDFSRDPLPTAIFNSFVRCERDQHFSHNIVVAGGGSYMENLPERLRAEVELAVHLSGSAAKVRVLAASQQERRVATWLGGSILGSLGSFHEMWMSKSEYDENGAAYIDRKCP